MSTTLTSQGQVTIPKCTGDELQLGEFNLLTAAPAVFSVHAAGKVEVEVQMEMEMEMEVEVVVHPPRPAKAVRREFQDRFDAVRSSAGVRWRSVR